MTKAKTPQTQGKVRSNEAPPRTGTEWSPGRRTTDNQRNWSKQITQPEQLVLQKVGDQVINHFLLNEQPPADHVALVNNSLQLIDAAHNVWRAKVVTTLFFKTLGPRVHTSSIRFRTQRIKDPRNPIKDRYSIHHNHIIFPS